MLVHGIQHQRDVGGEQIVHLVAERGFAKQFRSSYKITDSHVEVSIARRPVGDARERMSHQYVLQHYQVLILVFFKRKKLKWYNSP